MVLVSAHNPLFSVDGIAFIEEPYIPSYIRWVYGHPAKIMMTKKEYLEKQRIWIKRFASPHFS